MNDPNVFKLGVGNDLLVILEVLLLWGSKVKGKGHRVNSTTQYHFISNYNRVFSHSLGGDTSTITLQPRFIVNRYFLGGDTDNSNTTWVRTLRVHSSLFMHSKESASHLKNSNNYLADMG